MQGRILIIAGSDSGGGAGIQADIKTVTALNGYAMTAITALTAQNTKGVFGIEPVSADLVLQQIELCLDDIGADAVKTGMLPTAEIIRAAAEGLQKTKAPLVLDPVMIAKSGDALIEADAVETLKETLIPRAELITPNIPEAMLLAGMDIADLKDMRQAAKQLLKLGAKAALVKGGHRNSDPVIDVLATADGLLEFASPRLPGKHTHGTGCTLASAIATGLAQGGNMAQAVKRARDYLHRAMQTAPGFGGGHGPLNHAWPFGASKSSSAA